MRIPLLSARAAAWVLVVYMLTVVAVGPLLAQLTTPVRWLIGTPLFAVGVWATCPVADWVQHHVYRATCRLFGVDPRDDVR